jgi:hypothetical protein
MRTPAFTAISGRRCWCADAFEMSLTLSLGHLLRSQVGQGRGLSGSRCRPGRRRSSWALLARQRLAWPAARSAIALQANSGPLSRLKTAAKAPRQAAGVTSLRCQRHLKSKRSPS